MRSPAVETNRPASDDVFCRVIGGACECGACEFDGVDFPALLARRGTIFCSGHGAQVPGPCQSAASSLCPLAALQPLNPVTLLPAGHQATDSAAETGEVPMPARDS